MAGYPTTKQTLKSPNYSSFLLSFQYHQIP